MDLPFKVDQLGVQRTFAITHCEQITRRLNAIKNPATNEEQRKQSQQVCEDFKENFPLCLTCGLMLSEKTRPAFVRLFGLQIVEHVVKVRWSTMTSYEREYLKRKIMFLITTGTHSILQEQTHIKDVFASIVVEMIKHNWPHDWTDMLVEMERLSNQGEIQAQLTMLILLRLGEDLKGFQTTTPERRCDIMHTLTKKSSQILSLMLGILQIHGLRYRCLKAQSSGCVVSAALKALAHYLDWVAVWHITYKDCKLLERVRHFLGDPKIGMEMQLQAANCFLIAINRVSKLKVKSLMVLFGKEAMLNLLSAVRNADEKVFSEEQYALLKKLCQIVCALGILLCSLLGSDTGTATPATFGDYIDTLFTFTKHPSQFLCSSTQSTWRAFFNHEVLSRNPLLLAMLRKYLSATMTNLEKLGFPSKNDKYSCIDFASDETFIPFFTTYRDEQREVIKAACRLDPRLCFQMASECLKSRLSTPVNIGPINIIAVEGQSYNTSPFFIRLDAKNFFFESIISEVFQVQEGIPVNDGVELLKLVLDMETNDPLLLFYVIANISMLCPFLKYRNTYCPQVLTKLFTVIEGIKAPRMTVQKTVRRYACSCFSKMCRDNASIFLPNFEMLYSHVKQLLCNNELLLTQNEMCFLMEGLVLISNRCKDYERQKAFLEELVSPVATFLLSKETYSMLSNPEEFVLHVEADIQMSDGVIEELTVLNLSRISCCVSTIQTVLRWTRWPSDLEEAKAGGFVTGYMPSGKPIYRNPCTEQVLKLLDLFLALIRTQHNLFLPEALSRMSSAFVKAMNFLERRTSSIIEPLHPLTVIHDTLVNETEPERMQSFFCSLYENCFCILGIAGPSLMQDFYTVTDLTNRLLNSAFVNLENIPDCRICIMLREFVKPLVLNCPTEYYETLVTPILGPFLTLLHVRLTNEWQVISQRNTQSTADHADIIDSDVTLLTREVIWFIVACCMSNYDEATNAIASESDDGEIKKTQKSLPLPTFTELGVCLMKDENVRSALLVTVFTSLVWKDSSTCYKSATQLCWPLLNQVISEPLVESAVTHFFTMVLKGLEEHKDDALQVDPLVNLAFQIYVALRPRYADLKMVIKQVPGIMECYLEKFDEDILESTHCEQDTKKRKSYLEDQKKTFNCLIQGCFKKPLDVKHSKEVNINAPTDHSPPLKKSRGHSPPPVTSEDHSPPSMKPCDPSHSSVKPDYYSSSSVKPGHYSPPSLKPEDPSAPSNEWTTLEPVEDEPMVSMEDDGD